MNKIYAIRLLTGTDVPRRAAEAMGLTDAAICQWPDELPESIEARVTFRFSKLPPKLQRKHLEFAKKSEVA